MTHAVPFAAAALVLLTALPAQGRISDTILKTDGSRVRGVEVTAMTTSKVAYTKGGEEHSLDADLVREVSWHEPPELFTIAQGETRKGDYENAANHYLEVADNTARELLALDARFLAGEAMLAGATDPEKAQAAASALQSYIDKAPDGFRVPAARLLMARALRIQGETDQADAALQALEESALTERWGRTWTARAKFERALLLVSKGQADAARSAYQRAAQAINAVLASRGNDPELSELKTMAMTGEGETYVANQNYDQALAFFRQHTARAPRGASTAMQAAALAGEGEALYFKSKAADDAEGLRQAQVALAMANILDDSNRNTTAKALYYSGLVIRALGPDRESEAKAKAQTYFDTVARYYSSSPWATKARAEATQ